MIDYGPFMMIYKPSKLIYSSVHIDRVYHFIRDYFSRIPLYTYISFNGPSQSQAGRIQPIRFDSPFGQYLFEKVSKLLDMSSSEEPAL